MEAPAEIEKDWEDYLQLQATPVAEHRRTIAAAAPLLTFTLLESRARLAGIDFIVQTDVNYSA